VERVSVRGVTKRFDSVVAVDDVTLACEEGEFLVLLGPSGSGKTTLLRLIAGLEEVTAGEIVIADRNVTQVPPMDRDIAMVFQNYALYPHMTVRKNLQLALRQRKVPRDVIEARTAEVVSLLQIDGLLERLPRQLSGGQQQRVAVGRAIMREPKVFLMDEPLSNLDARLRDSVRTEIHELHERLHFTAVYVTHDQTEALALGDRLAIMREGKIEQLGVPEQIFEEPATEYVAGFIGMGNRLALQRGTGTWLHDDVAVEGDLGFVGSMTAIVARTRPEDLELAPPGTTAPPSSLAFDATIVDSEFGGRSMDVIATVGATRLQSRMSAGERGSWVRTLNAGQQVRGFLRSSALTFFDETGARIPSPAATQAERSVVQV
jgi:iron(III) transport system ATP-binding protein